MKIKQIYQSTLMIIASVITISATLTACDENDIERVIWIDDDVYEGLPAYTEWGYNSFGAYVNNRTFASSRHANESTMHFTSGENTLTFSMETTDKDIYTPIIKEMSFTFPYQHITKYVGLKELQGLTFDLASDNVDVKAVLSNDDESTDEQTLDVSSGKLVFKRVQILYIDGDQVEAIVSGTFEFNATTQSAAYEVRHGRFDVGVDGDDISF